MVWPGAAVLELSAPGFLDAERYYNQQTGMIDTIYKIWYDQ